MLASTVQFSNNGRARSEPTAYPPPHHRPTFHDESDLLAAVRRSRLNPMVEAGLMEAVPDAIRGRVFGFWITIGGLIGNLSHWLVGRWVEALGPKADGPPGYFGLYGGISLLLLLAIAGLPCLHAIRKREHLDAAPAATEPLAAAPNGVGKSR